MKTDGVTQKNLTIVKTISQKNWEECCSSAPHLWGSVDRISTIVRSSWEEDDSNNPNISRKEVKTIKMLVHFSHKGLHQDKWQGIRCPKVQYLVLWSWRHRHLVEWHKPAVIRERLQIHYASSLLVIRHYLGRQVGSAAIFTLFSEHLRSLICWNLEGIASYYMLACCWLRNYRAYKLNFRISHHTDCTESWYTWISDVLCSLFHSTFFPPFQP